jgi:hypothetical protein
MFRIASLALAAALVAACKADPAFHTPTAAAQTFARALEDKDYRSAETCLVKEASKILLASCNTKERADECAGLKKDPCPVPKDRSYPDCNENEVLSRLTDEMRSIAESHSPCTVAGEKLTGKDATVDLSCSGLDKAEQLVLRKEGAEWRVVPSLPMFPGAQASASK